MANQSIYDAFTQFWNHVVARIGDVVTQANEYTDSKISQTAQIQLITWEDGD